MGRVPVDCPCWTTTVVSGREFDKQISEKFGYVVVQCYYCGVIRTREREENYTTLYTEGDRYHVQEMNKIGREHYTQRFEHDYEIAWVNRIPLILEKFRTLDVGCANGAFVAAMKVQGFAAEGLELNPSMVEFAREQTDCPIFSSWDEIKGKYDIITYHDVFEHIIDPREELSRIRKHLRPDGLLILDCPDADEVFGPDARATHHEKPDQHLFYYTEHTLRSLLASHAFITVEADRPITGKLVMYARKNGE